METSSINRGWSFCATQPATPSPISRLNFFTSSFFAPLAATNCNFFSFSSTRSTEQPSASITFIPSSIIVSRRGSNCIAEAIATVAFNRLSNSTTFLPRSLNSIAFSITITISLERETISFWSSAVKGATPLSPSFDSSVESFLLNTSKTPNVSPLLFKGTHNAFITVHPIALLISSRNIGYSEASEIIAGSPTFKIAPITPLFSFHLGSSPNSSLGRPPIVMWEDNSPVVWSMRITTPA